MVVLGLCFAFCNGVWLPSLDLSRWTDGWAQAVRASERYHST